MKEDGFYIATRVINPILMKLRSLIVSTYGSRALDKPVFRLSHHDLAVYYELEKLRDELAMNRITRDDYVRELNEMLRKYPYVSLQVLQTLDELHTALTGKSLAQFISQQAKPHLIPKLTQTAQGEDRENVNVSVRAETVKVVSSSAGAGSRRHCPRCRDEAYFLASLRKFYCFNCKAYIE